MGVVSLVVIFGLRFFAPKVPGALVLVVGGLLATWLLGLEARGVALVGDVPSGLPAVVLPDFTYIADHLADVLTAALGAPHDRLLADRRRRSLPSPPSIATRWT